MADFVLGRIKFKWRGDWSTSTAYLIDDIVKYGGNTYVCVENHTSASTVPNFYTDLDENSYWELHTEGLFFKGDWSSSTFYKLNDLVKNGAFQYRCITEHTSAAAFSLTSVDDFIASIDTVSGGTGGTAGTYTGISGTGGSGSGVVATIVTDGSNTPTVTITDGGSGYDAGDQQDPADTITFAGSSLGGATDVTVEVAATDSTVAWQVFSEGLQFEDSFNPSLSYQEGDVVTYGGYTYVYINDTPDVGRTPTDNNYWDVLTTGFNVTGDYSHGTAYKTGDVVKYGGNSYVANTNHTNQYPANTDGSTNSTYWDIVTTGLDFQSGGYDSATEYNIGDVVRFSSSSWVMIKDRQTNVEPGTDATVWQLLVQGDTGAVANTQGDLIYQDASQTTRLPIGVSGSVLTTAGSEPVWSNAEGRNVIYVANSGSDANPGTQFLPYKTVSKALSVATSGDLVDFDSVTGGTGGTPGSYDVVQTNSTGSGTGTEARVILDGASTPEITITNGGSGHSAGDTITFSDSGSQLAGASSITLDVLSASIGDVVFIKNGVYRENLPLRIPEGVTVQGESLRGTEIRPAAGKGSQVSGITTSSTIDGATNGTFKYLHPVTTSGSGNGLVVNVTITNNLVSAVSIYHGGYGYEVGDTATLTDQELGGVAGRTLTITIDSLEDNDASNMFLLNNITNLVQMSMKGLTGVPVAGGTGKAAVTSLDPAGSILIASPYLQNCSSINDNNTGIQIDGNLHSSGNRSILANDFTQINSDGIGVHAIGGGRGEMVSVFTYYCEKSFFAESGGFLRSLNSSSAYGEQAAVADGTLETESVVAVRGRGEMLKYDATQFVGAATESDFQDTVTTSGTPQNAQIVGDSSGATADIIRVNLSLDYVHIENRSGNFAQGETVTITKDDNSTFQAVLDSAFGSAGNAEQGQVGPLLAVSSTDGTLSDSNAITVGANLVFAGDPNKYYRISGVTETNTATETALIRVTEGISSLNAIADNEAGEVTTGFSNVRLTGHDFLDIGTGGFSDTGYPAGVGNAQPADQEDEVVELNGGRVYFTSSDQNGDFRVGDLFRIQQATGIATLNADAFDLSGLTELQLGSIGAQLGATINEFSTDETLSGDANAAVPTERAIVGYTQRDQMGTGHLVPPTGTTGERPTGSDLKTGGLRYNSDLITWEGYNGSTWTGLGGGNPWQTTSSSITVAANDRYFVDTSGGAVTITLPASPQVGDQIRLLDLASTFDTNNLTIARNGEKINNSSEDLTVSTEDSALGLVYTGSTYGWKLLEVL